MSTRTRSISPPPKRRKFHESNQSIPAPIAASDVRIYSWNVNGIGPFLNFQPQITSFFARSQTSKESSTDLPAAASLRDVLRRYQFPSMLLLQEVKINPKDEATQRAVKKAVTAAADDPGPSYRVWFSLPKDKFNARGFGRKVYGVCSIIREDFAEEYVESVGEVDFDVEGRFLVTKTKPVGKVPSLAIFNSYLVNGTDAPYKSPETGSLSGTRHHRKLKLHESLQAECHRLEAEGFQVVLAGDMNVARAKLDGHPSLRTSPEQHCINRADFEARFMSNATALDEDAGASMDVPGLGMIDTFRHLHPRKAGFTYYPTGKDFGASADRVDMILISKGLEPHLKEAGMHETPADRGTSDHVPVHATLSVDPPC